MAKPRANIYTVLLALALVAILIGCLLLILEHRRYASLWDPSLTRESHATAFAQADDARVSGVVAAAGSWRAAQTAIG